MLRKILMGSFSIFAVFALAGAVLFYSDSASAQVVEDGSAEVQPEEQTERPQREGRQRNNRTRSGLSNEEKVQVVADTLGITVEDVEAAREDGMSYEELAVANGSSIEALEDAIFDATVAKVNELVESGDLTEEEGAAIIAKLELMQLKSEIIDEDVLAQAAADAIGVTVAEVEAAIEAREYSELLEENDVTREDVREAVQAAKDQMIDDAVANGDITEEQAEQLRDGGRDNGRGGNGRNGRGGRGGNSGADNVETGEVDA